MLNNTTLDKLKGLLGIQADTRLGPMLAYNSSVLFSGGTFYIIGIYFLNFLTYVEGLSAAQAGIVILCAKLCDAITDPAMGIITDRTRSRFGKHRKWFIVGLVPAAVTYFCMWNSFGISATGNTNATMIYYIFAYMLFSTAYTMVMVPHTAMFPEVAPNYSLRTTYNNVRTILDAIGSYSSFIISAFFFGFFETEKFSPASRGKFIAMGAILCVYTALPLLWTFLGTKEECSLDAPRSTMTLGQLLGAYKSILSNKCFRQYFVFGLFTSIAMGFFANSSAYFVRSVAQHHEVWSLLTTVEGVAEAVGVAVNAVLSYTVSKQAPARVMLPMMLASFGTALFVGTGTPVWVLFLIYILYSLGLSGAGYVTSNLFPDVTDVDYMITGQHREGTMATFSTFIKKTISGLMATFTGFILAGFGFDTSVDEKLLSTSAVFGVKFTFAIIPTVFISLAIVWAFKYKMKKADHELIERVVKAKESGETITITEKEKATLEDISGKTLEDMWVYGACEVVA